MNRRSFLTRCLAATCAAVMPWRKVAPAGASEPTLIGVDLASSEPRYELVVYWQNLDGSIERLSENIDYQIHSDGSVTAWFPHDRTPRGE